MKNEWIENGAKLEFLMFYRKFKTIDVLTYFTREMKFLT